MTKLEIHANLCDGLKDLYRTKNQDYGDSYAKVRDIIPESILVRLHDKLGRITQLMLNQKAGQAVKDESIEDTLRDLANYSLLELVERKYERLREMYVTEQIRPVEYVDVTLEVADLPKSVGEVKDISAMTSEEVVEYYKKDGK